MDVLTNISQSDNQVANLMSVVDFETQCHTDFDLFNKLHSKGETMRPISPSWLVPICWSTIHDIIYWAFPSSLQRKMTWQSPPVYMGSMFVFILSRLTPSASRAFHQRSCFHTPPYLSIALHIYTFHLLLYATQLSFRRWMFCHVIEYLMAVK